jgi:hypothetical protein
MCITAGCDPIGIEIGLEEKVRDLMEETVDKLTEQSSLWQDESQQWRQELEDLQDNLARAIRDAENDASYAEQHVINDANNLLDEVKVLAESSIHSVGASVGCTTSIVVDQVKDSLVGLLASFTGMSGPRPILNFAPLRRILWSTKRFWKAIWSSLKSSALILSIHQPTAKFL